MVPKGDKQSRSSESNQSTMSPKGQERKPSVNSESNQSTAELRPSTDNSSSNDVVSHDSGLQAENEELRRLLMDAQELLVQRNERLASLEGQIHSIHLHTKRRESRSGGFHSPEAHTHSTPSLALWQAQSTPQHESSLQVYDETDEGTSDHENEPPPPKDKTSKSLPTWGCLCEKEKIRRLPREQELEATTEVVESRIVDGTGDVTTEVVESRIVDGTGDIGVYTGSLLHELPHGKGRMIYDKDRSYTGEWEKGHWHGKGHVMSRDFDFKGMFVHDLKDGLGIMKWSDGRVYEGEFRKDEIHGQGLLEYPDGSAYKGEFCHGKREGKGESRFGGGGHYDGYWKEGLFHGHGQCTWPDGSVYLGKWDMGKTHGHGIELRADGSVRHAGLFENDEPIRQPNGNR